MPSWAAVRLFFANLLPKVHNPLLRLTDAVHVAVFAPSGAGKNVSIVEPFLLSNDQSCIVNDVKGENAKLTAIHRAKKLGQKIVFLDPWKQVVDNPDTLNPLDLIQPDDPESLDLIRAFAEAIVVKEPHSHADPHWDERAKNFIAGAIAAVVFCCPPRLRTLRQAANILSNKSLLQAAIQGLTACPAFGGLVAQLGYVMSVSSGKELDSVLSITNRHLSFLNTVAVNENVCGTTSFDLNEINKDKRMSIYLILPLV